MNKAMAWFASNHVAANLLMLFFIVGGVITALTMKLEIFPETSLDRISVRVVYSGASPAEVEEAINRRIEEKIAGLAGIRRIDSIAYEGMGSVTIELMQGWDLQKLLDEVKGEVDRITTFPEEAERPIVREVTRRTQVLWVAVYGDAPESTLKHLAERTQDEITNLPGVTLAELFGVRKGEIHIEVSEQTLRRYGLTLEKVADAVRRASLDLPAGTIKTKGAEILVRAKGRRYFASDYNDVPVLTRADGNLVTLGQIANLKETFEDSDLFARFNGKPAALIQVYRVAEQNALNVAEEVKKYIEKAGPKLPQGIKMGVFADRSLILKSRLDLLLRNMAVGLILVVLVLTLFLEVRLAFWVTLGIPISFCIAVWFLPSADVSINMVSLFAFILVLGIVVDDAIVVGENVFKKREQGMPALKAAIEGAQQVGPPVIFSVLTTVVAFAPLLMGSGMMGKIMRNIPTVVILVLLGSLLESLFILPAHLARSKNKASGKDQGPSEKFTSRWLKRFIGGPYKKLLAFCLHWRYATVGLGLCVLLLSVGTYTGGWLKFTLFPKVESDLLIAGVTMASGTPVERTTEVVSRLEKAAQETLAEAGQESPKGTPPLLKQVVSLMGLQIAMGGAHAGVNESGGHVATLFVEVLEGEKRKQKAEDLTVRWRQKVGPVPDAQSLVFQSELFNAGNAVEVHLSHPDESRLLAAAAELKATLNQIPGILDLADSFIPGKEELQLKLKPSGRTLGLTLAEISRQVRHAFYGAEALRLQRDKDEVKVMVLYPEDERRSLGDIERMRIRTPAGDEVPFNQVAQVKISRGYNSIQRAQRRRVVKVTADVDESVTNAAEVRQSLSTQILPQLKAKYPELRTDMEGAAREQRESLDDVYYGFAIAMFGIYMLLAIPFRSFSQPFIVMAAIPFG
ncbi:MAG: efflux RND transporter permease subunit, partial [Desulfarculaceae bacterium]